MPEDNGQKQTWWGSLPGILTGTAALITTVGGLILILHRSETPTTKKGTGGDTSTISKRDTLTPLQRLNRHRAF